ncbi:MAG TPA: serine/threonine protein kinase [Rhodanobacteraceae bacterium]|nr:serine/threonine protein kinase [Rhodanobacteraceae bacterium]
MRGRAGGGDLIPVPQPYTGLDPDTVLDAVAAHGFDPDGRLLALNSFENRVYQIGLDDGRFLVAKFYRPGRWSDAAITEEHAFAFELVEAELPVVAPLRVDGASLLGHAGFRFALYPRRGGRAPELESAEHLAWMGRLLARIHAIGARHPFAHRGRIDRATLIEAPMRAVLASPLLPVHLASRYRDSVTRLDAAIAAREAALPPLRQLRLHGDCHPGNVLWTDDGPHFVDLDDARMGPAIQDLWMLAGDEAALDALLEGYAEFRDPEPAERALIPALRAMRQVHHAGWIAQRWCDPAFPRAFPFAADARWWDEHLADIDEATAALD